jgi:hypothetical protein
VSDFLSVCINIILGWFFKNTLYFNPKKSHWGGKIMLELFSFNIYEGMCLRVVL